MAKTTPIPNPPQKSTSLANVSANVSANIISMGFDGDDRTLAIALQQGDPRAKAELFDRYGAYVEHLVARLMGLDSALYDFVQEIFVSALRDVGGLKQPEKLKPWLRAITVNTVRAELRRRSRWSWLGFRPPEEIPEVADGGPDQEGAEALTRVRRVIDRLPVNERLVLSLRFFEQMEQLQIAAELDISLATVKRRLVKATDKFITLASRDPMLRDRVQEGKWGIE